MAIPYGNQEGQRHHEAVSNEFNSLSTAVTNIGTHIVEMHNNISEVQRQAEDLIFIVGAIENRSWHEVFSIEASESITSNNFHLQGKYVRVTWTFMSLEPTAEITVYLDFVNGTGYGWWGDSGTWSVDNAVLELAEPGYYYIWVSSRDMIYYRVAVHDFY